ncbi:hypothetical protein C8J57DRAFT_1312138 [Mycena rebaudengoi]|nr:hypothetical protein C8J57DRAFT_1312138 [Mycena rebaudengoi]
MGVVAVVCGVWPCPARTLPRIVVVPESLVVFFPMSASHELTAQKALEPCFPSRHAPLASSTRGEDQVWATPPRWYFASVGEARGGGGEVVEAEAEADGGVGGWGDTRENRKYSSLRLASGRRVQETPSVENSVRRYILSTLAAGAYGRKRRAGPVCRGYGDVHA